jgi:hypothetical protein
VPFSKYSPKQKKLARVAAPRNKITAADLKTIRGKKSGGTVTKSRVNEAGNYTKPAMRKRLFESIKSGSKGGKPGQWSARKAQMLAQQYKKKGGGYKS